MGQLKHYANDNTSQGHSHAVEQKNNPRSVQQHWNTEGHCQQQSLGTDEGNQLQTFWPWNALFFDAAQHHVTKVIVQMPFDNIESIQRPKVIMLPAMKLKTLLMWCQPAEKSNVDVCIVSGDVGIGMVDHGMFPVPYV